MAHPTAAQKAKPSRAGLGVSARGIPLAVRLQSLITHLKRTFVTL